FLSVPSHAAFGVLMGYHVGLAKFEGRGSIIDMVKGFLLAVFFHGTFDFFLLSQDSTQVKHYIPNNYYLLAGALLAYALAIRIALKSIRLQEALSKQRFGDALPYRELEEYE